MPVDAFSDEEALSYVAKYAHLNENAEDLALRVYTSHLIGKDKSLVLHGGGNTSVKLTVKDAVGGSVEVVAVKGSGWDLSNIEPQGFPLVQLAPMRALRALSSLKDEDMVNHVKRHMMNIASPSPSIETLLHAFLPHKWVDHSHANAALAIMNQKDPEAICRAVYGDEVTVIPYIMPGFELAVAAATAFEQNPNTRALMLLQHGVFTFGKSAKESYQEHIRIVGKAEAFINATPPRALRLSPPNHKLSPEEVFCRVAPVLRGALSKASNGTGWLLHRRSDDAWVEFANSEEAREWTQEGPLTPDHVIRTKPFPLVLKRMPLDDAAKLREFIEQAVAAFAAQYDRYFQMFNEKCKAEGNPKTQLDKVPRLALVEGVGIVSIGQSLKACSIAADIYEATIPMMRAGNAVGVYTPPSGQHLFDIEYWSLEQAKLGKAKPGPLQGKVAVVTGGASGIGRETAAQLAKQGATIALWDINAESLERVAKEIGACKGFVVDVTSPSAVREGVQKVVSEFGGVDVLLSNAGKAPASTLIGDCSPELLKDQMELNFFSHQYVASAVVEVMSAQDCGGCLLFNASKAALNPGPKAGPYAISKAATIALMRQYALEYGAAGIRSNAVNADRVNTGLFTKEVVEQRARARNTTPEEYFRLNLLKHEVTVQDVAHAFVSLALAESTTAAIITVDGGNIAASVR